MMKSLILALALTSAVMAPAMADPIPANSPVVTDPTDPNYDPTYVPGEDGLMAEDECQRDGICCAHKPPKK